APTRPLTTHETIGFSHSSRSVRAGTTTITTISVPQRRASAGTRSTSVFTSSGSWHYAGSFGICIRPRRPSWTRERLLCQKRNEWHPPPGEIPESRQRSVTPRAARSHVGGAHSHRSHYVDGHCSSRRRPWVHDDRDRRLGLGAVHVVAGRLHPRFHF